MEHVFRSLGLPALAFALALGSAACGGNYIPNTDVDDTPENREVVIFCEKYRKAVERRDVAGLIKLASPKYYEDGGNIDPEDDIDFAGLEAYLKEKFRDATGIRYEIRYRRVERERDLVFVDYTYSASYRITLPGSDRQKWRSVVEENRLELVPDGEGFLIVAGM
jgi:hypothetical protein